MGGVNAKPTSYNYITANDLNHALDPRFPILLYNCNNNNSIITLPKLNGGPIMSQNSTTSNTDSLIVNNILPKLNGGPIMSQDLTKNNISSSMASNKLNNGSIISDNSLQKSNVQSPLTYNILVGLALYIKRTDVTANILTVNCAVGDTTDIGASIKLGANEELFIVAGESEWQVFKGTQVMSQSVRFLDDSVDTTIGALVFNTNPAFQTGVGYYGVNNSGEWYNIAVGVPTTITTSTPITGDGSGGSPATLAAGVNGTVLQYSGGSWLQGQSLTNVTYVDSVNGDDITGQLGNPLFPFRSIDAVAALAVSGTNVYVRDGYYTIVSNMMPFSMNYYFEPGTVVFCASDYAFAPADTSFGSIIGGNFILNSGVFITDEEVSTHYINSYINIDSLLVINGDYLPIRNSRTTMTFIVDDVIIQQSDLIWFYTYAAATVQINTLTVSGSGATLFYPDITTVFLNIDIQTLIYDGNSGSQFYWDWSANSDVNIRIGNSVGIGTNSGNGGISVTGIPSGGTLTCNLGSPLFDAFCYELGGLKNTVINDGVHIGPFLVGSSDISIAGSIVTLPEIYIDAFGASTSINLNITNINDIQIENSNNVNLNIQNYIPFGVTTHITQSTANITINNIVPPPLATVVNPMFGISQSNVSFTLLSPYTDTNTTTLFICDTSSTINITATQLNINTLMQLLSSSTAVLNIPIVYSNNFYITDDSSTTLTVVNSRITDSSVAFSLQSSSNKLIFQSGVIVSTSPITSSLPPVDVYIYMGLSMTSPASPNITYPVKSPYLF